MSIGLESRLNYCVLIRVVDNSGYLVRKEYLDIRPRLRETLHADNQEFYASPSDNWSRIGWRKLGNGRRWWIVADYSEIVDPFSELRPSETTRALTQLASVATAGSINTITVLDSRKILRSQRLRVENLDPSNADSFDVSVLHVNYTTNVVTFTPETSPGIPSALSRVSVIEESNRRLMCPSPSRAFFSALDFGNPLNILSE